MTPRLTIIFLLLALASSAQTNLPIPMPPILVNSGPRAYTSGVSTHGASLLQHTAVSNSVPYILLGVIDTQSINIDTSPDLMNWTTFRTNINLVKIIRIPTTNANAFFRLWTNTNYGGGVFISTNFQLLNITNQ